MINLVHYSSNFSKQMLYYLFYKAFHLHIIFDASSEQAQSGHKDYDGSPCKVYSLWETDKILAIHKSGSI